MLLYGLSPLPVYCIYSLKPFFLKEATTYTVTTVHVETLCRACTIFQKLNLFLEFHQFWCSKVFCPACLCCPGCPASLGCPGCPGLPIPPATMQDQNWPLYQSPKFFFSKLRNWSSQRKNVNTKWRGGCQCVADILPSWKLVHSEPMFSVQTWMFETKKKVGSLEVVTGIFVNVYTNSLIYSLKILGSHPLSLLYS